MKKIWILFLIIGLAFTGCIDDTRARKRRMAERVKAEFLHAWEGYKTHAWGHDELKPLSRGFRDWHEASLLLTPVDAFSTMKLMKLDEEADEAKTLILERLSFDHPIEVQVFEVTIRLLGGLLSAHELDGDEGFLGLAVDLADRLAPAFDSPTGMPYRFVNLVTGEASDPHNNPAEIGTLLLEWGALSKITGNPAYYEKAKRAVTAVFDRRSEIDLVGTVIDVETGEWENTESHIGARIDSYYEYLYKGWRMFGDEDVKRMWDTSIRAVHARLADETDSGLWYGRADMHTGARTRTLYGALDAFFPGLLALSGDTDRARRLQRSSYRLWTLHGIEPEMLDYATMEVLAEGYPLRPENIESAYYLYAFTGDAAYLDMAETYFESLVRYCRTEVAYAHLKSVISGEQADAMQSFFLAETLKYCYLIFAPEKTIDASTTVFNTEAHPLRIWPNE